MSCANFVSIGSPFTPLAYEIRQRGQFLSHACADVIERIVATAADTEAGIEGRVSFNDFIRLLERAGPAGPLEGPDPQVMETRCGLATEQQECPCCSSSNVVFGRVE